MRNGCFWMNKWGGLHVARLINQAFDTVFSESFFIFATVKDLELQSLGRHIRWKCFAFILGRNLDNFFCIEDKQSIHHLYGNECTPHLAIRVWSFVYLMQGCPEPLPDRRIAPHFLYGHFPLERGMDCFPGWNRRLVLSAGRRITMFPMPFGSYRWRLNSHSFSQTLSLSMMVVNKVGINQITH